MHEYEPNFLSDSNDKVIDPVTPPVASPIVNEGILNSDIYYNNHLIPNGAYFKVLG